MQSSIITGLVIAFLTLFLAFCGQLAFVAYKFGILSQKVDDQKDDINGIGRKLEERTRGADAG